MKRSALPKNPAVPPTDATLLTVAETAAILRLSVSCIRAWILERRIPYIKIHNKAVRIRRSDVDALIARSLVEAAGTEKERTRPR
jgi:excisionase family DNA binding protein